MRNNGREQLHEASQALRRRHSKAYRLPENFLNNLQVAEDP